MKIGKMNFKGYAAKKPLMISPTGKFLSAGEVYSQASLSLGSLFSLETDAQQKLTIERYKLEPDFKLGIIGIGILTKKDIIEHIRSQTEFGRFAVQAEMGYCNELMTSMRMTKVPLEPKLPKKPTWRIPSWKPGKREFKVNVRTRALFCENTTDSATAPFAQFRKGYVISTFQKLGYTVNVLDGTDDIRNNFIPLAKNALTVYIGGIGHGGYSVYTGHWGNHILEVGHYDKEEVSGKSIHFLSCQTASKLGPNTVSKGASSYAGYNENFIFIFPDTPTHKKEFELFASADSQYDIMMANGFSAQQAYNSTIQFFNSVIAQVPNTVAATYLSLDRDRLKLLGSGSSTIHPYKTVKIIMPFKTLEMEDALVQAGELID